MIREKKIFVRQFVWVNRKRKTLSSIIQFVFQIVNCTTCFWHSFDFIANILCSIFEEWWQKKELHCFFVFFVFLPLSTSISLIFFSTVAVFFNNTSFRLSQRISRRTDILIKVRKYLFFCQNNYLSKLVLTDFLKLKCQEVAVQNNSFDLNSLN